MDDSSTKYFLKCNNCGYLTEIVDNNVPYCFNCTLKFSNSYFCWKARFVDQKTIEEYKSQVCLKFSEDEIDKSVKFNNEKTEIVNLTNEQILRRAFIKEGISLDSGGFHQWDKNQIIKYLIFLFIVFGTIALITVLL